MYEPTVAGQRVQIRNIPFATDTLTLTAKAGYRLANRDRIELAYANKSIDYSNREVGDADDHRVSAQFVTRAREWGTTRVSYEFASLSGDTYVSYPYGPYNSTSLSGYIPRYPTGDAPFTLGPLRKYDIADRTENTLKAQTNFIVSDKIDFQLGGEFPELRLRRRVRPQERPKFQPQCRADLPGLARHELQCLLQLPGAQSRSRQHQPGGGSPDDSAGSPTYPLANAWTEEADDQESRAGRRHPAPDQFGHHRS